MYTAQTAVSERGNAAATQRAAKDSLENDRSPQAASSAPASQLVAGHRTDKVVVVSPSALRARGLHPYPEHERRMAAEYRQIKRPLMAIAKGRAAPTPANARVIMIASALPGEGKSFTSINLALSIALEKDTSVLLLDGDFAKAQVSRAFELETEPGLMDLLVDESRGSASAILPTTVKGLSLLPAGRDLATATELLGSTRMEQLIDDLLRSDPARIVLFDSPPLLLTTESRALSGIAGQIVVVVRAEQTTHKTVQDALACIGDGKRVGLVLNHCEAGSNPFYYGYGEYGAPAQSGTDRQ
jgi:exopolysaccharide/PEP-CTERM locus tyrosine autokinase